MTARRPEWSDLEASALEALLEHGHALIVAVDLDGRIILWSGSAARLTGVTRERALGQPISGLVAEEDRPRQAAALVRARAGEVVDGLELRVPTPAGEARVAFDAAPIRDGAGRIVGVVGEGIDLTRLRTLEAAAEQAERLAGLGRLAGGIVHELNNPLTAVTMYADALHEKWSWGGDAADLEKIKAIRDAGQRIQRLTRDLLAYARPASAAPEALELAPLVEQAARLCKPALKETGAQLEREVEPAPVVSGSRAALTQVLVNLITNAAQAAHKGGTIRVRVAGEGGQALVSVADDGAGMAEEVRDRAFEPFFTTRTGRAIGLGLPTARAIVERHGGTITLESAPERGTTVTVRLPARAAPPGP